MKAKLKSFLVGLLYEEGTPSRTGLSSMILIILPLIAMLALTGYLIVSEKSFVYYRDFLDAIGWLITTGCALLGGNKLITWKYGGSEISQQQKLHGGQTNENSN